ncbi:nucleoside triphosphate pyrophosphohydrolase [Falsirhodobacter algicola]|uniref:Nucleoside triphosphate pyrophosphohydrolase n=1 Tax=Falsirhodobacter algicola TaxID=2692330 RepID=A0A8J8SJV7_9RHOB|nr:nucleoside triphosphate pyrophosphohydrolase [Falsirhodobacter algicola]QUS35230.1 nucleoside triphosphate pyrophosphohydrolase [Falsirhodobacter algicola]
MSDDTEITRLLTIMRRLRDPEGGCPWDLEQDFASIVPYTIEEAYEVADAVERQAWDELPGELGDLLLQVVFHAQMADEAGMFTFEDVARAIADKMVARHPHVFGADAARNTEAQSEAWEAMKAAERAQRRETRVLDGVALGLPAATRALKLQKRAARVGFDWPEVDQVLAKILEEAGELVEARNTAAPEEIRDEFGDLLFAVVNLGRHLGVDPETALRGTNAKFTRRFAFIEDRLAAEGRTPADSTLEEMDRLWDAAKRQERADRR